MLTKPTNQTKLIFILGFGIFASFFGAGNLILPPYLGMNAGPNWWIVAIGFGSSSIALAVLALIGHSKLQGTMLDFGYRVSKWFSYIYCGLVYAITISLPGPRTAAVTHEMSIEPFFETSALLTSSIYFVLVLFFALNRSKVLEILGKFLTPIILGLVFLIVILGLIYQPGSVDPSIYENTFVSGLLEGYQTYDGMAGIFMGGILIISLNLEGHSSYEEKREIIYKSSLVAGGGLFVVYAGLILTGAMNNSLFADDTSRTALLMGLAENNLGNIGLIALGVLVALACFSTAVAIVVGTADFIKGIFNDSQSAYVVTVVIGCILGVVVGQMNVHYIINIAIPVLMFIYPITAVLIILTAISEKYASKLTYRAVVLIAFLFSIPDFLGFIISESYLETIIAIIPFSKSGLGWIMPAALAFILTNLYERYWLKRV